MTDDLIIQQLKNKEAQLIYELKKVQLALNAFIDKSMPFGNLTGNTVNFDDTVPKSYTPNLTYGSKILFILHREGKPMLVDEIAEAIHQFEPELELQRLHKSVSHNLSMLAKYAKIRKHPFSRKIKYSL
ncbi:hypothetical protein [Mucilaginibacter gotjawali]|uniref:Uncharacterized protein n=2 Tax=Mucilaginibacter gotjawali TaxID=1550579 RepID=A0A839SDW5_9SPHI|nr:hypothetical protein [Mucilaginibacter gotjawali]MBB3055504.1 hypothetical protein [Mucilaginibacter gotjawali]BAU53217.1 hypothetical protein MgSA37_01384 [Mucilaginibacter gotjawali]